MRVTKNMMLSTMLVDINKIQEKMMKNQMQTSSNRRILSPSDDPIGTKNALSARSALAENEIYQNNITPTFISQYLNF